MKGRVYFLGVGRYVKIGHTLNVSQRFHMLKTGCPYPVKILGSFPGTPATEKRLQKRFAAIRLRREWFKASTELMDFIADRSTPVRKVRGVTTVNVYLPDALGKQVQNIDVSLICRKALERAIRRQEKEEAETKDRKAS